MQTNTHTLLANGELIDERADRVLGDKDYDALLRDVQCNILSAHGHQRTHIWFMKLPEAPERVWAVKFLLGMLARNGFQRMMVRKALEDPDAMAAASEQLKRFAELWRAAKPDALEKYKLVADMLVDSEHDMYWKKHDARQQDKRTPEGFALNILLTHGGYQKLGFAPPSSPAFVRGMPKPTIEHPEDWEQQYLGDIHGALVVAYTPSTDEQESKAQEAKVNALKEIVSRHVAVVMEETGELLWAATHTIEPFGFRDSISQPVFYKQHQEHLNRRSASAGVQRWDASAPLSLALVPDPNARTAFGCGSYFVFQKLEQRVKQFYEQSERLAGPEQADAFRARLVGRHRNGAPLVSAQGKDMNNFDFSSDPEGRQCPLFAHIRKNNPRGDISEAYNPRQHRIVRRGVPYGPSIARDKTGKPSNVERLGGDEPVGMLFLCAQADIANQFEHLQDRWANKPDHPRGRRTAIDTIIGRSKEPNYICFDHHDAPKQYDSVVRLKGGAYFFAPCISFLRELLDIILA